MEKVFCNSHRKSRQRKMQIRHFSNCSRPVLEYFKFKDIARSIFDSCKNLFGATAGYISLLTEKGTENGVQFFFGDGLTCNTATNLSMPIQGMCKEVSRSGKAAYYNHFSGGQRKRHLPEGHISIDNILFVPLVSNGNAMGSLILANKPGGFIEDDVRISSSFGELMSLALYSNRILESAVTGEESFCTIVETARDPIISFGSRGNIIFWNKAAEAIFGYPANEAAGRVFTFILSPPFRKAYQNEMKRMTSTGKPSKTAKTLEVIGIKKDGSKFPMELSLGSWKKRGEVFFTCIIRDISERKRAEEALKKANEELDRRVEERTSELLRSNALLKQEIAERKRGEERIKNSEEKIRDIFENVNDGIIFMGKSGKILEINKKALQMYGGLKKELLGKNFKKIGVVHARDIPRIVRHLALALSGKSPNFILRLKNKKGQKMVLECSNTMVKKDGRPVGVIVIARDITERKKAEKELWIKDAAIASSINAFAIADLEGNLTYVNNSFLQLYGNKDSKQVLGKPAIEFWADEKDAGKAIEELQNKGSWSGELAAKRTNGSRFDVHISANMVSDDTGKPICMMVSGIDITERKHAEKQIKASLREKIVLLQEVHHRVKNNMQIISSLLKLQSRNIDDKQALEALKSTQNRVKSMALIHERLYQSRDLARINFAEYVRSLIVHLLSSYGITPEAIKFYINIKDVSLNINTAIPCGLIINELATNSLKHAFPDGKKGEIKISIHALNENELELVFSDNGVGIPEDVDFRRTESLGLHLVTILAEDQLHGEIKLDRTEGTSFHIRLRLKK